MYVSLYSHNIAEEITTVKLAMVKAFVELEKRLSLCILFLLSKIWLCFLMESKVIKKNTILFICHTHDDFDSADPSSVQDACNISTQLNAWSCSLWVLVAQWIERPSGVRPPPPGHGFYSCGGLRIFLCPMPVSCCSVYFSQFVAELKIDHLYSFTKKAVVSLFKAVVQFCQAYSHHLNRFNVLRYKIAYHTS